MLFDHAAEHPSQWAAMRSVSEKLGIRTESLRRWVWQAERDTGQRPGLTTSEREELKRPQREVVELKRANEILKKTAARTRVLELGCGTAEWASTFIRSHPAAKYVGVEFSPQMLEVASRRLESHRTRVELLDQDLNASLPAGPFDLVVSFFAVHHVENKRRLVEEVFASLESGGLFLYADITVAADPALERAFQQGWVAFMRDAGLDLARIPHVLADHRDNDLAESSATQLSYLRAAGFAPAEIIWCWEKFAVFSGAKPIAGTPPELRSTSGGSRDVVRELGPCCAPRQRGGGGHPALALGPAARAVGFDAGGV